MNTTTRFRNGALIGLFLLVLSLPTLDTAFKFDRAPEPNAARAPAAWPASPRTISELRAYPTEVESYFADHFGFRKRLIRWHNRWKKAFYKDLSGAEVIRGKDGWLFFTCCHMLDNLRGGYPFDRDALEALRNEIEKRQQWLKKQGKSYLFVVAPNKESVYPEFLPDWLQSGLAASTKLDQFLDYMRQHSDVPVLDLRPTLIKGRERAETYFKNDSHWNDYGGYLAAKEIRKHLHRQDPTLKAFSESRLVDVVPHHRGVPGDMFRMIGDDRIEDAGSFAVVLKDSAAPLVIEKISLVIPGEWPSEAMKPRKTELPNRKGHLLVLHDSFGVALEPHLGLDLHRTTYIGEYFGGRADGKLTWLPQVILDQNPDAVVDVLIERMLLNLDAEQIISWTP